MVDICVLFSLAGVLRVFSTKPSGVLEGISMRDIVCYCVSNCLIILVDLLLKIFNIELVRKKPFFQV